MKAVSQICIRVNYSDHMGADAGEVQHATQLPLSCHIPVTTFFYSELTYATHWRESMSTIQPTDCFRAFPRAPRAQYFANRVFIQTQAMTLFEETIDQNKLAARQPPSFLTACPKTALGISIAPK
jgi:hypothetical protein